MGGEEGRRGAEAGEARGVWCVGEIVGEAARLVRARVKVRVRVSTSRLVRLAVSLLPCCASLAALSLGSR